MRIWLDILRLIRLQNCLLAAAGVAVGAYLTWLQPEYYGPLLAALAAFFVCAAGNVVNDIRDIDIDRINRPNRVLVRGGLSVRFAVVLAVVCNVIAITMAVAVNVSVLLLVTAAILLLLAYNMRLKRIPLAGNVTVAVLSALTFMTGGWAVDGKLAMVLPGPLVPAVYAFLFHLVRELVKDAEDVEGDQQVGVKTLPQIIGVSRSVLLALGLFLILAILTIVPVLAEWFGPAYRIIVVYCVDLPLLALLILVWGNPTRAMLRAGSTGLKIGMLLGLAALMLSWQKF